MAAGIERNADGTFTASGAKEAGRRGGEIVTDLKKFTQSIAQRKNCSPACPIYAHCPAMPVSYGLKSKYCQFKKLDEGLRRRFLRLFFWEREGLTDEILTMVFWHGQSIQELTARLQQEDPSYTTDPGLVEKDARLLIDFYKMVYGENKNLNVGGSLGVVPDDPELLREVGDLIARRRAEKAKEGGA